MSVNISDRQPPQNVEIEQALLAGLMCDPAAINDVAETIQAEDFYRESHVILFGLLGEMWLNSRKIDGWTVLEELQRRGRLAAFGGEDYLEEILQKACHSGNVAEHAAYVRHYSICRQVIEASMESLREAYSNQVDADRLLEEFEKRAVAVGVRGTKGRLVPIREAVAESVVRLKAREAGEQPGRSTGYADLDDILDGLQPRKLYVLAARPSMGKSALALCVAEKIAMVNVGDVLFVSLEMDRLELADRWLMEKTGITGDEMRDPANLTKWQRDAIKRVLAEDAIKSRLVIDDPAGMTIAQLAARARRHRMQHGVALVVVDYMQLIDAQPTRGEHREQQVARISRTLKTLARELHCPVLALCQLNRAVENRDEKKPRLADLRESGQIEQDADAVMLLHRPEYYDPSVKQGIAEVIVAKNRGGRTGTIELRFLREIQRFESQPQGYEA